MRADACLWDGPDWLECKARLSAHDDYRRLDYLFQHILGIPKCTWEGAIAELRALKDARTNDSAKASTIYQYILGEVQNNSTDGLLAELRYEIPLDVA